MPELTLNNFYPNNFPKFQLFSKTFHKTVKRSQHHHFLKDITDSKLGQNFPLIPSWLEGNWENVKDFKQCLSKARHSLWEASSEVEAVRRFQSEGIPSKIVAGFNDRENRK